MLIIIFYESNKEIYCENLNVLIKDITVVRDYAEYFDNSPLGNTSLVIYTLVVQLRKFQNLRGLK